LSSLRAPCFHHVDEQVECPEIQERQGEGGLLLMMCSALKQSLDVGSERAEVEAAPWDSADSGQIVCRVPGVFSAYYTPEEARSRADIWEAHGHKRFAARLRGAAAKAERKQPSRARAAIGISALVAIAAGGWFMLVREPRVAPPQPLAAQAPVETSDALPNGAAVESVPGTVVSQAAPAATDPAPASSQEGPSGPATRSLSSEATQIRAPEPETPAASPAEAASVARAAATVDATPVADATPTADPTPAADRAPAAESKVRLPDIVMIPGGTFAMGGVEASELPVHQVTIKSFALGKLPVTVGEWKECVADKACADLATGPDDSPVSNVSYNDAQDYLAWLSRVAGKTFRLPSEAEWEYAARGGQRTKFWWGDQMRAGMANCKGCNETDTAAQPMKVGSFQANPYGLFDMGGCVDQWVADSWHKNYQGAPADGSAWVDAESFTRVIRSGSWKNDASYVRPGSRDHYDGRVRYPTHGFRVALSL
jgi:formylglycine-generating enzyme required for sulfatase activity